MNEKIFDDLLTEILSEKSLNNLRGGRAEMLDISEDPPQGGDGAQWICCVGPVKKDKDKDK